jgi:hypothetical protein
MSITINAGELILFDEKDERVIVFDWDAVNLPAAASISTSVWTIAAIKQAGATALTKDNESIVGSNRKTQVRLKATGTAHGDRYRVSNKIVTNESPAQTKEQSFVVKVESR